MRTLAPLLLLSLPLFACGENQTHPSPAAYTAEAAAPLACVPNLDGRIEASELTPALGEPVSYLISPQGATRMVDIAGVPDAQGHLTWDWSVSYADDRAASIQAQSLTGKWYAGSFPAGQVVVAFDAADTIEAVYSHDDQAMWLHGLASTAMTPPEGQTLLVYTQPIALYKFPFGPGSTWTSSGTIVNGTLRGLPYAGVDTYDTKDDAAGTMILPDLTFTQAHRVRTTLTNQPAVGATSTQRQVSFIFECFGEVARATSGLNETKDDFTTAAEIRRLGIIAH
jgi:hypothetical protein